MNSRTLVMGLGNRIMTDDGAGLVALDRFRARYRTPPTVEYLDGGTLGLDLLCYMEGFENILIADCLTSGREPGEVVRVEADRIETTFERCLSPHQMGLRDLIGVLRLQGRLPPRMTVVGIEGHDLDVGEALSPPVEAAMERAVDMMADVLGSWGVELDAAEG